jgi:hypothetical protein
MLICDAAPIDTWSKWFVRLTIGIFGLTMFLFVLAVAQVVNR